MRKSRFNLVRTIIVLVVMALLVGSTLFGPATTEVSSNSNARQQSDRVPSLVQSNAEIDIERLLNARGFPVIEPAAVALLNPESQWAGEDFVAANRKSMAGEKAASTRMNQRDDMTRTNHGGDAQ